MEIRDPIHGTMDISTAEEEILDSRVFQRLRQIKQLGFSEFSFPGGTHNRYIHSLGAHYLAGLAFDSIFQNYDFGSPETHKRLKQCVRLGALLHDVGHGPLSHTTEEVMPKLGAVGVKAYENLRTDIPVPEDHTDPDRQADHEDYTIKFITDSPLTEIIERNFSDIKPLHVACLIDKTLAAPDDFFMDKGIDFRGILSQIVSSELDVDRMDYLLRDAYFCGTDYGRIEWEWLLDNMTFNVVDNKMYLALAKRALYAFDDFLISRHHMNLNLYFHHKSVIYEEMLHRYLTSKDCSFFLPPEIDKYIQCTDYALYEHLSKVDNDWAKRITERRIYKVLFEYHVTGDASRVDNVEKALNKAGIPLIRAGSSARLSKYHGGSTVEKSFPIYVVDPYDPKSNPYPIEESTSIFQKYDEIRRIERIYVPPEKYAEARALFVSEDL